MQFKIVETITRKYVACVNWGILIQFNIIKPKKITT
jgi:hypothetical protein